MRLLTVYRGRFIEYLLDRPDVKGPWQKHTEHRFLERLADGTLPIESFKYYLIQDYLYLVSSIVGLLHALLTPLRFNMLEQPPWLVIKLERWMKLPRYV